MRGSCGVGSRAAVLPVIAVPLLQCTNMELVSIILLYQLRATKYVEMFRRSISLRLVSLKLVYINFFIWGGG